MPYRHTALLLTAMLVTGACTSSKAGPMTIDSTTFDPSLHVDLKASTRTASGLYYRDIVVGNGAQATPGQQVLVRYTGTLANGQQFDATGGKPPYSFVLGAGRVIAGWDEGVAGMRVGGTRQLIIPAALGYGANGNGPIPPDAVLVFTVQLVAAQ